MWDPRMLDIEPDWYADGPLLPIEFARVSRGDRLTLVIVENAPLQPTLWSMSRKLSLEEARGDLMAREGATSSKAIGSWPQVGAVDLRSKVVCDAIERWAIGKRLAGAVWTALGPKAPDSSHRRATDDELVGYLRTLKQAGRSAEAQRYIELAPPQIQTPLRARIRAELGWG